MQIDIAPTPVELGRRAGADAARALREAIRNQGSARLVVATGASQFDTLAALTSAPDLDWSKVSAFHLDEYLGLTPDHKASFVGYLRQRFVAKVPGLKVFHELDGMAADPQAECRRLTALLDEAPIDVACIGIGENGHIAFNDPPADFDAPCSYHVVELDEACRKQQVGEGWFPDLAAVPTQAISMSVPAIMRLQHIVCSVPDERKAQAVHDACQGPITPDCPASKLQEHPSCHLYLDEAAASKL